MNRHMNPAGVRPPAGRYTHVVEIAAGTRTVHISGQVAVAADGTVPESLEAQTEQVFANLKACLAGAGMGFEDVVKVTVFLVAGQDVAKFRAGRDRVMGDAPPPASTLVFISALAAPEYKVEVEAIAAKA